MRTRLSVVLFALLAVACGKSIGDPCTTNVDCATDGTRDCDLSQPGGYCTVLGCDEKSCPSESVCIRIFPYEVASLSGAQACLPCLQETQATDCPSKVCNTQGFCAPTGADDPNVGCTSDQICLPDGFCVPRNTERRYCEKTCGSDGDCRGGYKCLESGIEGRLATSNAYGSIALVANQNQSTVIKFCAPNPNP
jgi:hypothetical protein